MTEIRIVEGAAEVTFNPKSWQIALKWDNCSAYRIGLGTKPGTSAVDIVGLHDLQGVYFIEMKDPRGHSIENKWKDWPTVVAEKVRDTIAALTWVLERDHLYENGTLAVHIRRLVSRMHEPGHRPKVIFWLDEDRTDRFAEQSALKVKISSRLDWLNPKVSVVNRKSALDAIPDTTIRNLVLQR